VHEPHEGVDVETHPRAEQNDDCLTIDLSREAPALATLLLVSLEHLCHVEGRLLVMSATHDDRHNILHGDACHQDHAHQFTPIMECHVGRLLNWGRARGRVCSQGQDDGQGNAHAA